MLNGKGNGDNTDWLGTFQVTPSEPLSIGPNYPV